MSRFISRRKKATVGDSFGRKRIACKQMLILYNFYAVGVFNNQCPLHYGIGNQVVIGVKNDVGATVHHALMMLVGRLCVGIQRVKEGYFMFKKPGWIK